MNVMHNQISQDVIAAYKKYVPLHIVCDYLKAHDKPTARSWDEVFERNSSDQEFFLNLLTEIICFGRKTIFAYNADEIDLASLNSADYTEAEITKALKRNSQHHKLFRRSVGERFSAYTFVCTREAQETYILPQTDLTVDARQRLWTPNSVIKLNTKVQITVFDSLIYDSENKILFITIDNSKYSFEESAFEMQSKFINEISQICPSLSTIKLIDFFPAIDDIYKQNTEGLVHRLAFECNTGAVRDEKLKQGQLDLRAEIYHISGKAAIGGNIRPYKLGVTWHPSKYKPLASEIELEINGNRQNLHKSGGVFNCEVKSAGTFNELCFALNRVALYAF